MAAATAKAAEVMEDLDRGWIEPATFDLRINKIPRSILLPFAQKFTVPTTSIDDANDILRLFKFPGGAYLWDMVCTPSDMDTDATPALTYSLLTTNDADVTQVTLVSGSTNGQAAAGSDRILSAAVGRYVGGQWCVMKCGTAADVPAAGTLKLAWVMSIGAINRSKRGTYMADAFA